MKRLTAFVVCFWVVPFCAWGDEHSTDFERYWPQWRGPHATGVAPYGDPPMEWSEDKNVRWKIEIPGKGHGSPVVWGDQIFVLTAVETDRRVEPQNNEGRRPHRGPPVVETRSIHKFVILAISRLDGSILWQRTVREELPHEGTHPSGSWASISAITDGKRVYAFFGSRGLYCFDMQGELQWEKDLGDMGDMTVRLTFGEGSSPVLHGDKIVINWDHEGQSFIVALDQKTGRELWRVERDEITSWSTPLVVAQNGKPQVITSATNRVRSYDLETGELIWECNGMTLNTIPSPVAAQDMVYVTSGFRGNALLAIRLPDARGDLTGSEAIVWRHDKDTPYTP